MRELDQQRVLGKTARFSTIADTSVFVSSSISTPLVLAKWFCRFHDRAARNKDLQFRDKAAWNWRQCNQHFQVPPCLRSSDICLPGATRLARAGDIRRERGPEVSGGGFEDSDNFIFFNL